MKKYNLQTVLFSILIIGISSCDKIEIYEPHEEEVITTLSVKFSPQGGGNVSEYLFEDIDGPGGLDPVIESINLAAHTVYDVEVLLLNKTIHPADTLNHEVAEEGDAHRIYYLSAATGLQVTTTDIDENGIPLGLKSQWETGAPSTGKIDIVLRHYGGTPPGKELNDPVNSTKSSTDLTTENMGGFPISIQ